MSPSMQHACQKYSRQFGKQILRVRPRSLNGLSRNFETTTKTTECQNTIWTSQDTHPNKPNHQHPKQGNSLIGKRLETSPLGYILKPLFAVLFQDNISEITSKKKLPLPRFPGKLENYFLKQTSRPRGKKGRQSYGLGYLKFMSSSWKLVLILLRVVWYRTK